MSKTALVCGAGGFIGSDLVKRLNSEGVWTRGADPSLPSCSPSAADQRLISEKLSWQPSQSLRAGLEQTYGWIEQQVHSVSAEAAG